MPNLTTVTLLGREGSGITLHPQSRDVASATWLSLLPDDHSDNLPGKKTVLTFTGKATANGVLVKTLKFRVYEKGWTCGDMCAPDHPFTEIEISVRSSGTSDTVKVKDAIVEILGGVRNNTDFVTALGSAENFF